MQSNNLPEKNNASYITDIYKSAFPACALKIKTNGGSMDDARDVFQEAMVDFLVKMKKPGFEVHTSTVAYLQQACFYIWLGRHKKQRKTVSIEGVAPQLEAEQTDAEKYQQKEDRITQMHRNLKTLDDPCRQLLNMFFFEKKKDKEIAVSLAYTTQFVKTKRRRCIAKLRKAMSN